MPLIRQVAAAKGVAVVDVFSAFGGHNFDPTLYGSAGDQVHPNTTTGGQRIADTVYAALKAAPDGGAADAPSGATDAPKETGAGDTGAGDAGGADAGKEVAVSDTAVTDTAVNDTAVTDAAGSDAATAEAGPSTDAPVDRTAADTGGTPVTPASDGGGCGCRTTGSSEIMSASWVLALLGLELIRRRRRRSLRRRAREGR